MLVFLSDIHLTDGSSGETIKSTAFMILYNNLKQLINSVKNHPIEELHLVLLGDIFDIIRSSKWLASDTRPWDDVNEKQKQVVLDILEDLHEENRDSLNYLIELEDFAAYKKIPFHVSYVIGNHDWIINRYQISRNLVAGWLGLLTGSNTPPFPEEMYFPEYRAFARHGDCFDRINHMEHRNRSSIGDALVIELLNRYPLAVEENLKRVDTVSAEEREAIRKSLKELDNVRPLLETPSWVIMIMNRTENPDAKAIIEDTWKQCVDDFFRVPFIRKMDIPLWPDFIDLLEVALKLSSHGSMPALEKIAQLVKHLSLEADHYELTAMKEPRVLSGEACCVLYGHTHEHVIIPLDQQSLGSGKVQDKVYFNTGTWRKTWNRVTLDKTSREFIGWHVLTYVCIFKPQENGEYQFEVWNGALG